MRSIVINTCYGGYRLSDEVIEKYSERMNLNLVKNGKRFYDQNNTSYYAEQQIKRDDPILVEIIKELGEEKSSGSLSKLKIVEIPEDVDWQIDEYDGIEWVAEKHRVWS